MTALRCRQNSVRAVGDREGRADPADLAEDREDHLPMAGLAGRLLVQTEGRPVADLVDPAVPEDLDRRRSR
jgi:hypothetical protein